MDRMLWARFGEATLKAPHAIQWLSDNGPQYTATANLPMFAQRASTQDSPALRKHLREHLFIVKERPEKGRWEAKARALERIVFLST